MHTLLILSFIQYGSGALNHVVMCKINRIYLTNFFKKKPLLFEIIFLLQNVVIHITSIKKPLYV